MQLSSIPAQVRSANDAVHLRLPPHSRIGQPSRLRFVRSLRYGSPVHLLQEGIRTTMKNSLRTQRAEIYRERARRNMSGL